MTEQKVLFCKYCGQRLVISAGKDGFSRERCPSCGKRHSREVMHLGLTPFEIEGSSGDADQKELSTPGKEKNHTTTHKQRSPWLSSIAYLTIFVVVIVMILAVAKIVPILTFSIILLGAILLLLIVGAFQLRQDSQFNNKNFLELVVLSFKHRPWFKK